VTWRDRVGEFIGRTLGGYVSIAGLATGRTGGITLSDPYSQHPVVYSCVKLLADSVSQVPFKIYKADESSVRQYGGDGVRGLMRKGMSDDIGFVEVKDHPLTKLFDRPNPLQSAMQFWQGVTTFLVYNGECCIRLTERSNVTEIPEWMIPMNPGYYQPKPDRKMIPMYWEYTNTTEQQLGGKRVETWELIRPRTFNHKDIRRGLSPLATLEVMLEMDWGARLYNAAFFENDATPGGFFLTDTSWKKQQRDDWIEGYENRHKGASNAFKWSLLSGIKDVKLVGYTPKDLQFPTLAKMSKEEIAMVWRVPLLLLSRPNSSNFATANQEVKSFWNDTVIPLIRHLEDIYWAEFFQYIEGGRYWGAFDLSNVEALQEGINEKVDTAKVLADMLWPINAINERLEMGFEPVPWGDEPLVNMNMVPVSAVTSGATLEAKNGGSESAAKEGDDRSFGKRKRYGKEDDEDEEADCVRIRKQAKEFDKEREIYVKRYLKKYKRYLFEYRKAVLEAVDKHYRATPDALATVIAQNQAHWDIVLMNSTESIYFDSMGASYQLTASQLGATPFLTATSPETIAAWTERKNVISGVNKKMFSNVQTQVAAAIKDNVSVSQVKDVVRDVLNFQGSRAMTIARTEVGYAMSRARAGEMKKHGVEYTLWSTAGDAQVRTSHQEAEAWGPVPLGEIFPPVECRWPLDHWGPVGEVVNCRCVSVPATRDDLAAFGIDPVGEEPPPSTTGKAPPVKTPTGKAKTTKGKPKKGTGKPTYAASALRANSRKSLVSKTRGGKASVERAGGYLDDMSTTMLVAGDNAIDSMKIAGRARADGALGTYMPAIGDVQAGNGGTLWASFRKKNLLDSRWTFNHEFAHAVDDAHRITGETGFGAASPPTLAGKKRLQNAVDKGWKSSQNEIRRLTNAGVKDFHPDHKVITPYSTVDKAEYFSEAIADYMAGGARLKRQSPGLYRAVRDVLFEGKEFPKQSLTWFE
jgi:HK97 family phage portal protein